MRINKEGYLVRRQIISNKHPYRNTKGYDYFLVKFSSVYSGYILLGKKHIYLPKEYIGKKIKIKIEIVKDDILPKKMPKRRM